MPKEITSLLVKWSDEGVSDQTGESEEVDFDIPFGFAIAIYGVETHLEQGDFVIVADKNTVEALVSLDGNGMASDAISSQALFDAEKIRSATIFNALLEADGVTSGAVPTAKSDRNWFPEPLHTARNPGIARISDNVSGGILVGIWYKWVTISDLEFAQLVASRRG